MQNNQSHGDKFSKRYIEFFSKFVETHSGATPADFDALEAEKDNILQAVDVAHNVQDWNHILRIVRVIGRQPNGFLDRRGYWAEALHCYEKGIKAARKLNKKGDQGVFLLGNGMVLKKLGEFEEAQKKVRQAYRLLKGMRSRREDYSDVVHELGMQALDKGELNQSEKIHLENLELRKRISYVWGIAYSTHELGRIARMKGKFPIAKRYLEESLRIRETYTDDTGAPGSTLHDLGCAELAQGIRIYKLESFQKAKPHYSKAKKYFERSYKLKKQLGMLLPSANTLHEMGRLASFNKQYEEARKLLEESLKIDEALHAQAAISHNLFALAENEYENDGDLKEAERLCRKSFIIKEKLKDKRGNIACDYLLGLIAAKRGEQAKAIRLLQRAHEKWSEMELWQADLTHFKLNQLKNGRTLSKT